MDRIRVLHIFDKISISSGVCSVIMNYYNHIDKRKVVFDFMVNEPVSEEIQNTLERQGSKIYVMPALKIQNYVKYMKQLKIFFYSHADYAIVHGHTPNVAAFYLKVAKDCGIKIRIIHSHNAIGAENKLKRIRNRILYQVAIKNANTYFACGRKAAEYLYGKNFNKNYYIMNNAIDLEKYKFNEKIRCQIRKQLDIEGKFVLGNVGRFCKQKNQKFLINILAEIIKTDKNVKLLLIGDGKQLKEVQQDAEKLKVSEYIVFTGEVNNVFDYIQGMDIFILPSLFEGLPVVCVEAQAIGLPCLISSTVTKEIAINQNIEFVSIFDSPKKWGNSILEMRKRSRQENIEMPSFDIKDKSRELTNIYYELIEKYQK
ncbi:MAG: glycosyltransferase family 1 protein [Velocimicrobium sp.]